MPNLYKELEQGAKAKSMQESEIYQQVVTGIRQGIFDKWRESPIRDKEGQHELKLMLKILDDFERNVAEIADTGKLAEIQIEREKTLAQSVKDRAVRLINGRGY